MPLDAICLRALTNELKGQLLGARIDKVQQPARDQIVLLLRGNLRLLINAGPNQPRVQLTEVLRENPAEPPMLCMLLRKHLVGGRITEIEQSGLERIVTFTVRSVNELGESGTKKLVLEAMGRRSNLLLLDEDDRILDCMRRVEFEVSGARALLPGLYVAMATYHQEMIPTKLLLAIIESKREVPFDTVFEVVGLLAAFELLQEAGLHLPQAIGTAVSIIGGLVVGTTAVDARLVSPAALIVTASAGICGFTLPSRDLSDAVRIWRFALAILAGAGGLFALTHCAADPPVGADKPGRILSRAVFRRAGKTRRAAPASGAAEMARHGAAPAGSEKSGGRSCSIKSVSRCWRPRRWSAFVCCRARGRTRRSSCLRRCS